MKRPFSHRLFSALLALLVLTASVGMAVLQHTCRQSGHRTTAVVFSAPQHRCPTPAPNAAHTTAPLQLKDACCDFQTHFHKADAPAPALSWAKLLPPPLLADWLPTTAWLALRPAPLVAQAAAWHATDSSPPPRAGRALLAFIQVLVV